MPLLLDLLTRMKGDAEDHVLLYTTERDTHVDNDSQRYVCRDAFQRLGLPKGPTLSSLKHLGNTEADREGTSAAIRAAIAGHTTPRLVETAYRVLDGAEVKAAVERMDQRARRKGEQPASGTTSGTTTKDSLPVGA